MSLTLEQKVKKLERLLRYVRCNALSYNTQEGTSYTLHSSDMGNVVTFNNSSAVTVTIPQNLPDGFSVVVIQKGTGQITFTTSGTTLNNYSSHTKTAGQYAVVTIIQDEVDTEVYYLAGDTGA